MAKSPRSVVKWGDCTRCSGRSNYPQRRGTRPYFVSSDYWSHDTTLWVKDFHGNDPRFVYFFFRWMAPHLAAMDVGSANPTLNRNHVHPIKIRWPSVSDQRVITRILGALDDQIDLNRRTNETLEAMARMMFKDWFVDFGH